MHNLFIYKKFHHVLVIRDARSTEIEGDQQNLRVLHTRVLLDCIQ